MTPRPPRSNRTIKVEDELWAAAMRKAEERGDVLSEEIRKFLHRYVRSTK
jgi:hypothetical protein